MEKEREKIGGKEGNIRRAIGRVRFQSAKERSLILTRSRVERMALVKQRR